MDETATDRSVVGLTPTAVAHARLRRRKAIEGRVMQALFFSCALVSVLTTVGIFIGLAVQAVPVFQDVNPIDFLFGTTWQPIIKDVDGNNHFGVLPLVSGTFLVAAISALVAIPAGVGVAIFLSEYAPDKIRRVIKPALEVLAGIPTVVYGYFALTFITPQLQHIIPDLRIFNALSAGLIMGLMILPMVSSLTEDAMLAVPRSLREAAYALGATKLEVATRVVVPAALSGIVTAFIVGISRAIGETMLVTIAAGATPNLTLNPTESIQTMTAYIAQIGLGEAAHGSIEFNAIFAVGLMLFILTLGLNILGNVIVDRWREKY